MNSAPAARPPSLFRRALRSSFPPSFPKIHWDRYGLVPRAGWSPLPTDSRYASRPRAERFRLALEETGELFEVFGRFLSGRADLLPSSYLTQLLTLRSSRKPQLDPSALPELKGRVTDTALAGFSPAGEIYSATFEGRPVTLEMVPDPARPAWLPGWRSFSRQILELRNSSEQAVSSQEVLDQFREWLDAHADMERKRSMLKNLADVPFACATRFPKLIEELQTPRCLAYEKQEGEPLAERLRPTAAGAQALETWAESLLEQTLILSLVDAEARAENYLLLADGGIGFRAVPCLVPVPVEWHTPMVQYTAAAAAGNSQRAIQMLSRICYGANAYEAEQRLLERLSALQPELKIQQVIPASVVTLENYWRTLARAGAASPLFLHLYHRNLVVAGISAGQLGQGDGPLGSQPQGQMNSSEAEDVVAQALWPVLGRLLQYRFGELLSSEKGLEWLYSSGLLLMSATRQVAVTLEQVRDNDVALLVEGPEDEPREELRTRRVASAIRSALALGLLLLSAEIAGQSSGALAAAATAAAAASAVALCAVMARIK